MDCPEIYVRENGMQRRDASDILSTFLEKMIWKQDEVVLDIGCGPGDVTSDILYPFLKNKIKQLVSFMLLKLFCEFFLLIFILFTGWY